MGIYISTNDIKVNPVEDKILKAGWVDTDIERVITEAESYIEGKLTKCGYTRAQLKLSSLIKILCINYCFYAILRDIYTKNAPNVVSGEEFRKWKEDVDRILEDIEKGVLYLVDSEGEIIVPANRELLISINTMDVKRAITMSPSEEWDIDASYYDEKVVGKR